MIFESQLAESVFKSKYLLSGETTPEEAISRVVKAVSKIYPEIEKDAYEFIDKQWFIPAGGVWRASGNPNKNVSYINCTNLGHVEDNLESIFDSAYKWAKFAAFGQGEGIDISNLRPAGAIVHNSSETSTGAVSFMYIFDAVLKIIAQKGRRGASLISIIDSHPDIEEFITIKDKPESDKSRIDTANISIQVTDNFMKAVINNEDWLLHFENKYEKIERVVKARDIWNKICHIAWKRGDPGLQFLDTWRKYSNSDTLGYPLEASNACGEIPADKYNVCMLSHINLAKYSEYGDEGLKKLTEFGVKFLNACRLNEYLEQRSPIKDQREKLITIPRIGLGFTGFADYLLDKNIPYGSKESITEMEYIGKTMAKVAYETGYQLAKKYGSYPAYDKQKIKESQYIQHLLHEGIIDDTILDYQFNVNYLSIAPTGTASLIANVGGSGIEPLFSRYMVRRERATGGDWKEWFTFNPYVERYLKKHKIEVTKENADKLIDPKWVMSFDVKPIDKIKIVAEAQKWFDNAISVTFNLPEEATEQDVSETYIEAWKHGLKGVTVYREGSLMGVLITEKNYNKQNAIKVEPQNMVPKIERHHAPKRPVDLECTIHRVKIKEEYFLILIGLMENEPYEVFVTNLTSELYESLKAYKKGIIRKHGKGDYNLVVQNGEEKIAIKNIGKTFNSDYEQMSRLISTSLRHGVPLQFLVDQLSKDRNFISFSKAISRVLKIYIKEGEKVFSSEKCPNCGSELVFSGGCKTCSNSECGWSKCD